MDGSIRPKGMIPEKWAHSNAQHLGTARVEADGEEQSLKASRGMRWK